MDSFIENRLWIGISGRIASEYAIKRDRNRVGQGIFFLLTDF
jgi:hypothetical protein